MDPFIALPWLALEQILLFLPDLTSLYSLRNASPAVATVLYDDEVLSPIFENILVRSRSSTAVSLQTRALIRLVVRIRWAEESGSSKANTLPTSLDAFTDSLRSRNAFGEFVVPTLGAEKLPQSVPPHVVDGVLGVYTRTRGLTHLCLRDMLDRCKTLQAEHLENPRFKHRPRANFADRQPRPPGQRYQPQDASPPSWAEEQRVARAMWRLVLFNEVRRAYSRSASLHWDEQDLHRLSDLSAEQFWHVLDPGEQAELATVLDWAAQRDISGTNKNLQTEFLFPPRGQDISDCYDIPALATKRQWADMESYVENASAPGYHFGTSSLRNSHLSPLRYVDFKVFRPYGFAIWDMERMIRLEFLQYLDEEQGWMRHPPLSPADLFFTWQSIMTKPQMEELEKVQESRWGH